MSSPIAYPVQVLRAHTTALEAAITVCLADPDVRPVHRLRTETRRVEALLFLLDLVPDLPKHRKQAERLRRVLRKLRRDAGEVRDLDVHRKMLEAFADAETRALGSPAKQEQAETSPAATSVPSGKSSEAPPSEQEATSGEPSSTTPDPIAIEAAKLADDAAPSAGDVLHRSALTLRKHMGHKRDHAASTLQATLKDHQRKASRAAEALLDVLKSAEDLPLPGPKLLEDAEALLTRDGLLRVDVGKLDRDELHTVRKAAKAARYVAESLPEDPAVAEAARRFEALQEAGGQWHDAWQLARAARRRFGRTHELTRLYREERDRKLRAYREALRQGLGKRRQRSVPKTAPTSEERTRRRPAPKPAAKAGPRAAA